MSVALYDLTVGSYVQIAEAAVGVLQKGAEFCAANGKDPETLVAARLYEDMADLHFQVVCITHHSLAALQGAEAGEFLPPDYPRTDYAGLQAMTAATVAELEGLDAGRVNGLAGNKLVFRVGGNEIPFTAEKFLLSFSLPNFYFHATTAYDLLRANGVPLGKRDFLGAMKIGT